MSWDWASFLFGVALGILLVATHVGWVASRDD